MCSSDLAWGDQRTGPRDPQPGTLSGPRDVNRSAGTRPIDTPAPSGAGAAAPAPALAPAAAAPTAPAADNAAPAPAGAGPTALAADTAAPAPTVMSTAAGDQTGPAITTSITAPGTSGSYDLGDTVTFSYSATDPSGVTSSSATLDDTTTITSGAALDLYTLTAGTHTIKVTATDGLGNISAATVTFQIHATIAGLVSAVNYGVNRNLVSTSISSRLVSTLNSAQSQAAGNVTAAKSYLNTFVTQVQGAGAKITSSFATLLVNWAQDLIARL